MSYNFCFASEAHYPNYTKRIKTNSLKAYLDLELDKQDIPYYISTNRPQDFDEYKDNKMVRICDVNELRKDVPESFTYELYPEDPTGIYAARYPWNMRRFLVRQAGLDGYSGCYLFDADSVNHINIDKDNIIPHIESFYEPKVVGTNQAIFKYEPGTKFEVFKYHDLYIKHFNLTFTIEQYTTVDGPGMFFMGESPKDLLDIYEKWNFYTIFGYKQEFGFGCNSNFHTNLSFTLPAVGFTVKAKPCPFYPEHHFEDRY